MYLKMAYSWFLFHERITKGSSVKVIRKNETVSIEKKIEGELSIAFIKFKFY